MPRNESPRNELPRSQRPGGAATPFSGARLGRLALLLPVALSAGLSGCKAKSPPEPPPNASALPGPLAKSSLPLPGPWQFRQAAGSRGAAPAPGGLALADWMPASVPGCVHTDLLDNARIDDPFAGTNERAQQWIGERDWEYKTWLEADAALLARQHVELVFQGLDTYASVFLNGALLRRTDNMFREWRVPVKPWLRPGPNTLLVRFRSALAAGQQAFERHGYPLPASNDHGTPAVSMFTRKAPYHFGWDWGPRFVTAGIWRPVLLEAWDDVRFTDLHVRQLSLGDERADLSIEARLESARAGRAQLEVSLAQGTVLARVQAPVAAGSSVLRATAHIDRPERWWPNGLGRPHLYTIRAALSMDGVARDERQARIGLRTLEVVHRPDADGKSFSVHVNGAPVFMKGANYIPQDSFLPRVGPARYEHLLRSAAAAHMNMLRVWGGGVYEDDRFYELCDELGLLVWQDFMFACSLYPGDEAFLENVRQEAIENVRRLRHHPSLALWAGNNENEWAWRDWGWKERFSEGQRAEAQASYRKLFQEILPDVVAREDPGRFYTRSSPSANDDAIAPNQPGFGDMHYWGVWHSEEPYEKYADHISRFMSEYGFQSFPELESVARYARPEDLRLDSPVMLAHQRHERGNQLIQTYLERDFRAPKDFPSFLYVSQVLQATVIQFAAEAHRRRMPYNAGSLYWQLDDCWPVASWSSIDYYGRWKALHYAARRFFAPALASIAVEHGAVRVYGISDQRSDRPARLELRLTDFEGRVRWQRSLEIVLAANTSRVYFEAPEQELLGGAGRNQVVLVAELVEGAGRPEPAGSAAPLASGHRLTRSLHYFEKTRALALPNPELEIERLSRSATHTSLRLRARRLARAVRLSDGGAGGHFEDNYFDLLPGESVTVGYEGPADAAVEVRSLRDTY